VERNLAGNFPLEIIDYNGFNNKDTRSRFLKVPLVASAQPHKEFAGNEHDRQKE
jgi:hypothetical protein